MTQTTLSQLRAGLGSALSSIEGLRVYERPGGPYVTPCAIIRRQDIPEYYETMGRTGSIFVPFGVIVAVARVADDLATENLDLFVDWVGDSSVPAALMADKTLGGVAGDVFVRSATAEGPMELDGTSVLASEFTVEVHASRERES